MSSVFKRGRMLYAKLRDADGVWRQVATNIPAGREADAEAFVRSLERDVLAEIKRREKHGRVVTVSSYARAWLDRRKTATVRDDRTRLERHALPVIGDIVLAELRPHHLRDLMLGLRAAATIAPKTIREVAGVLHTLLKSAVVEELIATNPAVYERGVLPPKIDKDPAWRAQAIFTRAEVEQLLSDDRIPEDRRVVYALKFFAGRHTETLSATWAHYDMTTQPLGTLHLVRTKTKVPRQIPVHQTLAAILLHWREVGWPKKYGRVPAQSDEIVPTKAGLRRKADAAQLQLREDLARVELRVEASTRWRRGHDLRRTLVTLARADGASDALLRWVTHGPRPSEILDVYSSPPWAALCAEVSKLRIGLGASLVQWLEARAAASELERPRRDSNPCYLRERRVS